MCRDIELHWGEPVESTRKLLQTELEIEKVMRKSVCVTVQ